MSGWWWAGAAVVAVAGAAAALSLGCNPPAEAVREDALRALRPGANAIVIVYSRSGQTARAARALADELGADYLRLQGEGGEGDSFWKTPSWRSRVSVRPASLDLRPYRLVVLASPIWYWRPSAIAMSFADENDFTGKDVALLFTYEGAVWQSGLDGWRQRVEQHGGRAVKTVGIDRKHLRDGESIEARARVIARDIAAASSP